MTSHPDTASPTSVGVAEPPSASSVPSGPSISAAWIGGGAVWVAAGLIFAGDGWRFTAASVTWFVADLLLLVALVGLHRRRLHGGSKVGSVASSMAMVARGLFAVGEVATIASGHDEGPLIPLGALLTAVALTTYGITVLRRPGGVGPVGWALLATGLYPFVAMFPVLAVTGEPNYLLIALWGVPAMAVGFCLHGGRRQVSLVGPR